ncbi:hypothetical protein RCL_jg128.t1 [Rhizophagus clarus]|uniref:Uncharacterized protein n=1 Tax=Rhizophagus clarus TaxID=94130 RepID=A0A8H3LSS7_9GLOM|nr:hypothetical protein RCL_jg128.t1 [Rhizophagus clarus]
MRFENLRLYGQQIIMQRESTALKEQRIISIDAAAQTLDLTIRIWKRVPPEGTYLNAMELENQNGLEIKIRKLVLNQF